MLYGCWYGRHPEAFFNDEFDRLVALAGICIVDVAHPQQPITVFGEQFLVPGSPGRRVSRVCMDAGCRCRCR